MADNPVWDEIRNTCRDLLSVALHFLQLAVVLGLSTGFIYLLSWTNIQTEPWLVRSLGEDNPLSNLVQTILNTILGIGVVVISVEGVIPLILSLYDSIAKAYRQRRRQGGNP